MDQAIAYYRVSTQRQGRSGLGIEAQRAAVQRFAEAEGIAVIAEHAEAESGKGSDALLRRPQLRVALDAARQARCPVIVAKLDRLSRDVASSPASWPSACRSSSPSLVPTPIRSCCISMPPWPRRSAG